jgi:hypothetical protein
VPSFLASDMVRYCPYYIFGVSDGTNHNYLIVMLCNATRHDNQHFTNIDCVCIIAPVLGRCPYSPVLGGIM